MVLILVGTPLTVVAGYIFVRVGKPYGFHEASNHQCNQNIYEDGFELQTSDMTMKNRKSSYAEEEKKAQNQMLLLIFGVAMQWVIFFIFLFMGNFKAAVIVFLAGIPLNLHASTLLGANEE